MSKLTVLKLKKSLKREMQLVHTLDLLRQIAVSEFHHLESEKDKSAEFILLLGAFFYFFQTKNISLDNGSKMPTKGSCVVAITSNEGFLGALNNEVLRKALELYHQRSHCAFVVIGTRGARRIREMEIDALEFPGIPFPLDYSAIAPLQNYLMEQYSEKKIGSVSIVYPRCHSIARQSVETTDILPFNIVDLAKKSKSFLPIPEDMEYVLVEPDAKSVIEYTVSLCFQRQLYEIFWSAKLSEVAARTIELNARYDRLSKNVQKITSQYFRACHEVIDEGIREVFSSINFSKQIKRV